MDAGAVSSKCRLWCHLQPFKANMGFKALLLLRLELLRRLARPGFLMFGPRIQLWTVGAAPVFGVEAFLTIHNWSFSRNHAKIKKLDVAHPHKSRCARDMHAAIFVFKESLRVDRLKDRCFLLCSTVQQKARLQGCCRCSHAEAVFRFLLPRLA